jgi:uncharacterized protein (DUF885 family)
MNQAYRIFTISILLTMAISAGCQRANQPELPGPVVTAPPTEAVSPQQTSQLPARTVVANQGEPGFDEFLEESYQQLLLRDPQLVTELGLADAFGVGNDQLTDISDSYLRETQQLEVETLKRLREFDRSRFTPQQQLSAEIYEWYLDDRVRGHPYLYHDYPVSFLITTGVQLQLEQLFTDLQPLSDQQDVEDYLERLAQVETKIEQLIEGLERREQAGVVMPGFLIPWVLADIQEIAQSDPRLTPFYRSLEGKLDGVAGISEADKQAMLDTAEGEIATSVLPAYQALAEALKRQQPIATDEAGVWKLPQGQEYYEYALRHHTTSEMTAEEIHQLGLTELDRIHAEMRLAFAELGYPDGGSLSELYNRAAGEAGFERGDAIAQEYERLIEEASLEIQPVFNLQPEAKVVVKAGAEGDYYTPPSVDGSRPGLFYAQTTGMEPRYSMPSLAYHEAVPGHHFQLAIALEQPLPSFRRGGQFNAFTEGWALYAERLAWEQGFYEQDPYGNLGRLQMEAFRAARLVVDTGLHAKKWTFDQAVDFMTENTGLPRDYVQGEVGRYIIWPGQATSYTIGMIKILELRQQAMNALGDQFDLKDFHDLILKNGAVPLVTLERIVQDYIASNG